MEIIDLNDTPNQENEPGGGENKRVSRSEDGGKASWKGEVLSWVLTFAIAIGTALLLKNFVIINANVPTGSMENTILPGDDLLGFRLSYLLSEPERGDIVIFKFPDDESQKFIKRIIGLPGEKVVIEDGKIYINDSEVPLEETYLKEEWVVGTGPYEFNVPEGCYFVMGDNRNDSNDARFWDNTYVTAEEIIGKAEFIYYPFSHIKSLR
jgi:signal peptidase I